MLIWSLLFLPPSFVRIQLILLATAAAAQKIDSRSNTMGKRALVLGFRFSFRLFKRKCLRPHRRLPSFAPQREQRTENFVHIFRAEMENDGQVMANKNSQTALTTVKVNRFFSLFRFSLIFIIFFFPLRASFVSAARAEGEISRAHKARQRRFETLKLILILRNRRDSAEWNKMGSAPGAFA